LEDIDLSYQMQKAGYRILFEKKSIVGHYHEEGSIKSAFTPADVTRIAYRISLYLFGKIYLISIIGLHIVSGPLYDFCRP